MSKKDKKIAIEISDSQVKVGNETFPGYELTVGKMVIGLIAELNDQYAIVKNGNIDVFFKNLEKAVEVLIENYNLTK